MKKLLLGFILLIIAIGLGYSIQQDPGYLIIYYHHWSLSTSLWTAIISLLIILVLLHYAFKLIHHFFSIHRHLGQWSHTRKHKKALNQFDKGVGHIMMLEWKSAISTFKHSIEHSPAPLINAYFLVFASSHMGDQALTDSILKDTSKLSDIYLLPLQLLKVQIQIKNHQWHDALNTLDYLFQKNPKNPAILSQYKPVLMHLEKWDRLEQLLPAIQKSSQFSKKTIEQLYNTAYSSQIASFNTSSDDTLQMINDYWKKIPKSSQKNPDVFHAYVKQLIKCKQDDKASELIEDFLSNNWQSSLTNTYGQIVTQNTHQRILTAEKWLSKYPGDATLLLCLGRLYCQEKIWASAHKYLQESLQLHPQKETLRELSLVAELTGKHQEALNYLKKSIEINE
tara:strand:- start:1544 stop:2728 length:1185 start_codon:yes stop_codon:yes gene_type:complete